MILMEPTTPISQEEQELQLVWKFFDCAKQGVFVEVGANYPTLLSQT
jgi:hypothetical protein